MKRGMLVTFVARLLRIQRMCINTEEFIQENMKDIVIFVAKLLCRNPIISYI